MGRQPTTEHDELSRAYEVYTEWGPDGALPRLQRLSEEFPQRGESELQAWMREFAQVNSLVSELARAGGTAQASGASLSARLTAAHPWLGGGALQRALFMADYEAWHDGWR